MCHLRSPRFFQRSRCGACAFKGPALILCAYVFLQASNPCSFRASAYPQSRGKRPKLAGITPSTTYNMEGTLLWLPCPSARRVVSTRKPPPAPLLELRSWQRLPLPPENSVGEVAMCNHCSNPCPIPLQVLQLCLRVEPVPSMAVGKKEGTLGCWQLSFKRDPAKTNKN